jgi:hypothetical protein
MIERKPVTLLSTSTLLLGTFRKYASEGGVWLVSGTNESRSVGVAGCGLAGLRVSLPWWPWAVVH